MQPNITYYMVYRIKAALLMVMVLFSTAALAQTKDNPTWLSVSVGHHEYNGDYSNEMFHFDIPKDMTAGIGLHHYINSNFDFLYTLNLGSLDTDYGTRFKKFFWNNNFQFKYKLANGSLLSEESKVKPFLTLGAGLTAFTGKDEAIDNNASVIVPLGIGFDIPLSKDLDFVISSTYNRSFNDYIDGKAGMNDWKHDDFMVHTVGLKFNLFKNRDADADGVSDSKDLCPTEAGSELTNGCPDTDMDGVADKDDRCPELAGLTEFNGCPDSDGDGIEDAEDACPKIAGPESLNGCADTDNDGIADPEDACPNVAGKMETEGCPDSDGDMIIDSKDACPQAAGTAENGGCPDTDNDGVIDKDDECPTEAGAAGNNGCPGVSEEVQAQLDVIFQNLLFGNNSSVIDASSLDDLDTLAGIMQKDDTLKLSIEGHTDSRGNAEYNMSLSQSRADAVKQYLIEKGISDSRITAIGYGETQPVATNDTAEGRNKNRRVELELFYD